MELSFQASIVAILMDNMNIQNSDILCIYPYGSRVYGTADETSDHDFIVVVTDNSTKEPKVQFRDQSLDRAVDFTLYSASMFQKLLDIHEISAIECISLPHDRLIISRQNFDFKLDLKQLRDSVSARASNSWVKTKKKLTVLADYNPYIGKKSLFHSLRILMFGKQIAMFGKVVDFAVANHYWYEIVDANTDVWEYYKAKYQQAYNDMATQFRAVAPK